MNYSESHEATWRVPFKANILTHSFLLSLFYLTSFQKKYFNSPHLITIYIYFKWNICKKYIAMLSWVYILILFVYSSKYWVRYIFKRADNLFPQNVYMRVGGMRYKKEVRSIEAILNAGISRLSLRWGENDQVWYEVEKESSQLTFVARQSCPALWIPERSQYFTALRVIFFNFACTSDTIEGFKNYNYFHNFSKSIPHYCQWIIKSGQNISIQLTVWVTIPRK